MYSLAVPFSRSARAREPLASLTFDLDTLGQDMFPGGPLPPAQKQQLEDLSYAQILPRILDFLRECGVPATFFVIGRHVDRYAAAIRTLVAQGHEVANHTMTHPREFSALSRPEIRDEIDACHTVVARVTGVAPSGFRAPGYTINAEVLAALTDLGYTYDASLVPSWSYSMLKLASQRLFNRADYPIVAQNFACALAPQAPFRVDSAQPFRPAPGGTLMEIPVTTMPVLQWPLTSIPLMVAARRTKVIEWSVYRTRPFLSVSLHDFEFTDAGDAGDMPRGLFVSRYLRRTLDDRLRQMRRMVVVARRFYRFVTLRDVAAAFDPAPQAVGAGAR
jgi:hypothetical protein